MAKTTKEYLKTSFEAFRQNLINMISYHVESLPTKTLELEQTEYVRVSGDIGETVIPISLYYSNEFGIIYKHKQNGVLDESTTLDDLSMNELYEIIIRMKDKTILK